MHFSSPYSLARYFSPTTFLEHAERWLCAAEAEHNLILGLCDHLQRHPESGVSAYLATIEAGNNRVLAVAFMTPPRKAVLSRSVPPEVTELFALDLAQSDLPVPGVLGPFEAVAAFGERWTQLKDCAAHTLERMGIYELREVRHPPYSPGRLRPALPQELDLLTAWNFAFHLDVGLEEAVEACRAEVERLAAEGALYVWEHRGPVSMAAVSRHTPHGACLSLVYTPPELRGRGYATSSVADLSQKLLDSGRDMCCLFAQIDNPTPNDIYQRIGFRRVAEWEELVFSG